MRSPFSSVLERSTLAALAALACATPSLAQIVQVVGDPQQPNGSLDLDNPFVPTGPIAPDAPAITASGLASVDVFGPWAPSPNLVDPNGNAVGQGFYARNGALAVIEPGLPVDVGGAGFGAPGYVVRTQVPVEELGLLFVNERYVRYRIELLLHGSSLGTETFHFGDIFEQFETHDRVSWSGPNAFDEVRINIIVANKNVGIDQLLWRTIGGPLGARICTPAVPNSSGAPGELAIVGTGAVGAPIQLTALHLPMQSFGYFITSRQVGFIPQPGSSLGVLCLGGAIGRFVGPGQLKNSGTSGAFSLLVDSGALPTPTQFVAATAGEDWTFTTWFRDVAAGGFASSNFTDAVTVTFQ